MQALLILATVIRVVEADTIEVRENSATATVRVLGLECPPRYDNAEDPPSGKGDRECATFNGKVAYVHARLALKTGSVVTLEGVREQDRDGRLPAYLRMANGADYGLMMIQRGWCSAAKLAHPRQGTYQRVQASNRKTAR